MGEGITPSKEESIPAIENALISLGCPKENSQVMASQLDKRARQLADLKETTYQQALLHLLQVVKNGIESQKENDTLNDNE